MFAQTLVCVCRGCACARAVVVNLAAGMLEGQHINHEETLHYTGQAAGNVTRLVRAFLDDHAAW